jgi:hypothetical protein
MGTMLRTLVVAAVVVISAQPTSAQQSKETTITEPGIYKLADLFKAADTVAVVEVLSGDTESYDIAVYKAKVVKSFKGPGPGETLYFGPYVGERLGWEYILFLRNVSDPLVPKRTSTSGYGTIRYSKVFDEGFSSMMVSYECVFDGKEIREQCDYGVRVCTDYIILPKSTRTFPPIAEDTPFGCRWVRKTLFVSMLEKLGSARK